jgi:hypothetical protein
VHLHVGVDGLLEDAEQLEPVGAGLGRRWRRFHLLFDHPLDDLLDDFLDDLRGGRCLGADQQLEQARALALADRDVGGDLDRVASCVRQRHGQLRLELALAR